MLALVTAFIALDKVIEDDLGIGSSALPLRDWERELSLYQIMAVLPRSGVLQQWY